ncbi:hypothetical protein PGTUg99_028405 [Puccinia graminis f. sp. tritici]|uniref:Uncharacterized protein n=1 Tax=Puccinia graminis f. sp. tritici TaxID=56615 RepID=A0A5B0RTY8_PUCGR|nr:hypothetical protein PGTUg99_028405 [Puccinia graminis f. sp. tritici]
MLKELFNNRLDSLSFNNQCPSSSNSLRLGDSSAVFVPPSLYTSFLYLSPSVHPIDCLLHSARLEKNPLIAFTGSGQCCFDLNPKSLLPPNLK